MAWNLWGASITAGNQCCAIRKQRSDGACLEEEFLASATRYVRPVQVVEDQTVLIKVEPIPKGFGEH